jgi:signal peptidase II
MLIFAVAAIVLALDQISKYWIVSSHVIGTLGYTGSLYDLTELRSFLAQSTIVQQNAIPQDGTFIVLSFTPNDAALWGLGSGNPWASRLLLALTSVFLFLLLFFTIRSGKKLPKLSRVIAGLLIGGSIGNLYDRIAFGYVRDMICTRFIDFPIFNIADSAICIAIALLIFEAFFRKYGVFECFEDEYRDLFRLPTREEAEKAAKERKKNKLSRFEELIPEDESEEQQEGPHDNGNDPADRGDGSAAD